MAFEGDFLEFMGQEVQVFPLSSRNAYGASSFAASGSTLAARVVERVFETRMADGTVAVASHEVWLASTGTVAATSKFVLPDGTSPPLLRLSEYPDEDGTHHYKLLFGAKVGG